MKNALKFMRALIVTTLLMLAFRALTLTVYTVRGRVLEPRLADGDRVLVNRWSYGLRTGGSPTFRYARWLGAPVERGDLVVFNDPADTLRPPARRKVMAYYCTGVPGDTVQIGGTALTVPGKRTMIRVTEANMRLLAFLYNNYEGRRACVRNGKLYADGRQTDYATFTIDYYWFSSSNPDDADGSRRFGFVPETCVIGKVAVRLYGRKEIRFSGLE